MDTKHQGLKPKRFVVLDYLRGLAALSVVLFHFTYGYDNGLKTLSPEKFYFRYGNLGVQLFFMISGFVIFMTLNNIKRPMDFVVSRFSRLYPAYWAALFISTIFVFVISSPFNFDNISAKQFLINLTMLQHWFKVKDIDGAYWTLAVELMFYVIMFGIYNLKQLNNIVIVSAVWLCIITASYFRDFYLENYLKELLILNHASLFIAGMMFYKIKVGQKFIKVNLIIVSSYIVQSVLLFDIYHNWIPIIALLTFYCLFYYISYQSTDNFRRVRVLEYFGTISYCLYLVHENIGLTIIFQLKQKINSEMIYLPIAFLSVVIIASCITYIIEKPSMKLIKRFYDQYKIDKAKHSQLLN